mgnify:CR=1 FL=1
MISAMMKVILPTDFSDNSWKAMTYAAQLYSNIPCQFYILNTYNVPHGYTDVGVIQNFEPLKEESEEGLALMLGRFNELDHHNDSKVETISRFASLVDTINELEKKDPNSFVVVMGTRGATGIGELFLGTMTSHVIEHTSSPVICVPNVAELSVPESIMLAVDKDGVDRRSEIAPLLQLAQDRNAHIKVVNVPENEEVLFGEDSPEVFVIDHYLDGISHSYYNLSGEYKEDTLTSSAEKDKIDLIAMIKRDRGFWKNLFHRSLTKSMSFHSDIPLLILRD